MPKPGERIKLDPPVPPPPGHTKQEWRRYVRRLHYFEHRDDPEWIAKRRKAARESSNRWYHRNKNDGTWKAERKAKNAASFRRVYAEKRKDPAYVEAFRAKRRELWKLRDGPRIRAQRKAKREAKREAKLAAQSRA